MSEKAPLRVVVTGAAGQIAYSLLYQIASGYVFGEDQVKQKKVVLLPITITVFFLIHRYTKGLYLLNSIGMIS